MTSNTVLMVNVHGQGYAYYWREAEPRIEDELISSHLPGPSEGVLGANVSFGGSRISSKSLLVSTVSGWDKSDEFGRRGLFLFHGVLFVGDEDGLDIRQICGTAVALLRTHRMLHSSLSRAVRLTARVGGQSDVELLFRDLGRIATMMAFDEAAAGFLDGAIAFLRAEAVGNDRLQVQSVFPFGDEFAFASLIGLQAEVPSVRAVGGGFLEHPERFDHVCSVGAVPGFRRVVLGLLLPQGSGQVSDVSTREGGADKEGVSRMVTGSPADDAKMLSQDSPQIPTGGAARNLKRWLKGKGERIQGAPNGVVVGILLGILLGTGAMSLLERRRPAPKSNFSGAPHPKPPDVGLKTLETTEPIRRYLVEELFSKHQKTREDTLELLRTYFTADEGLVPMLLAEARGRIEHKAGVFNSLVLLQTVDPDILVKYKDDVDSFANEAQNNGPQTAAEVQKLKLILSRWKPPEPSIPQ